MDFGLSRPDFSYVPQWLMCGDFEHKASVCVSFRSVGWTMSYEYGYRQVYGSWGLFACNFCTSSLCSSSGHCVSMRAGLDRITFLVNGHYCVCQSPSPPLGLDDFQVTKDCDFSDMSLRQNLRGFFFCQRISTHCDFTYLNLSRKIKKLRNDWNMNC